MSEWIRTRGWIKTIGCGLAGVVTTAFYIPWVLGAACILAAASIYSTSNAGAGILTTAAGIAASPALFFGEAIAGIAQGITGKKISLTNLWDSKSLVKDTSSKQNIDKPFPKPTQSQQVVKGIVITKPEITPPISTTQGKSQGHNKK